jgi:hypothetical protein
MAMHTISKNKQQTWKTAFSAGFKYTKPLPGSQELKEVSFNP